LLASVGADANGRPRIETNGEQIKSTEFGGKQTQVTWQDKFRAKPAGTETGERRYSKKDRSRKSVKLKERVFWPGHESVAGESKDRGGVC